MKELISKIEAWAHERNIINGSTPLDQAMKLFSEFGELADAVGKKDWVGIKDGVGDVFVVLVVTVGQIRELVCLSAWEPVPAESLKRYILGLGEALVDYAASGCTVSLYQAICLLNAIAEYCDLTLEQCVSHAYEQIKNRTGIMYNGTYIKNTDPQYAKAVAAVEAAQEPT